MGWDAVGNWVADNAGSIIGGVAGAYDASQGSNAEPYYHPGQEQALGDFYGASTAQFNQGPDQYYPGQTVAPLDPNVVQGQNAQLGQMDQANQIANWSGEAAGNLAQGGAGPIGGFQLQDQIGFGIPEEYQNAIMNPIMNNLEQRTIPGLHTQSTQQGAFGGSRAQQQKSDAATQATEAATNAMIMGNLQARQQSIGQRAGDISAQLQGRGQDITQNQMQNDAMYRGVQAGGEAMNQQFRPGAVQEGIGGDRTAYEQAQIQADKNRFDWNRNERTDYIDRLGTRAQGMPPMGGELAQSNPGLMEILAGFGSGANIWNTIAGNGSE